MIPLIFHSIRWLWIHMCGYSYLWCYTWRDEISYHFRVCPFLDYIDFVTYTSKTFDFIEPDFSVEIWLSTYRLLEIVTILRTLHPPQRVAVILGGTEPDSRGVINIVVETRIRDPRERHLGIILSILVNWFLVTTNRPLLPSPTFCPRQLPFCHSRRGFRNQDHGQNCGELRWKA